MSGIRENEHASAALSGCAPIEWLKKNAINLAKDFFDASKIATKFINEKFGDFKDLLKEMGYAVRGTWEALKESEFGKGVANAWGNTIQFGQKVAQGFKDFAKRPCVQALAKAIGIGAAVAGGVYGIFKLFAAGLGMKLFYKAAAMLGLGKIIRAVVRTSLQLYNFNWQISDEDLKKEQRNAYLAWVSNMGDSLGEAAGNLVCGGITGGTIVAFNPRLAAQLWEVAGAEIKDEIIDNLWNMLHSSLRMVWQIGIREVYMNARYLIKKIAGNPGLKNILPQSWAKAISEWGNPGQKPWILSEKVEEKIEALPSETARRFWGSFVGSGIDGCTNSMIAISYAV